MGIRSGLAAFAAAWKPDPFDKALAVILKHEGGWVHHPADPGGITNLGVTKRTWEEWTGAPASPLQMRNLTKAQVAPLYRKNYWQKLRCDEMPAGVGLVVFDFGVNAGPKRAARYLQTVVGTASDGQVGPATINAVKQYCRLKSAAELIRAYSEARRNYYRQLRTFRTFGKGWLRRVAETEEAALAL